MREAKASILDKNASQPIINPVWFTKAFREYKKGPPVSLNRLATSEKLIMIIIINIEHTGMAIVDYAED